MSVSQIVAIISHLYIVDTVWNKVAQQLIVQFGRKFERAILHVEAIVHAGNEVQRPLTLDMTVERCIGNTIACGSITQLLEERRLVIQASGKTQADVLISRWNNA